MSETPNTYLNLVIARASLGEHQRAINDYGNAMRLNPDFGLVCANRALAYTAANLDGAARKDVANAERWVLNRTDLEASIGKIKSRR